MIVLSALCLYGESIDTQTERCKQGDLDSCYEVGVVLTSKENRKDQEKKDAGMVYLRKACQYGHAQSCDMLGDNYYKDGLYQAAIPYLEVSCKREIKDACEALGTIYRDGHDVRQDDVQARVYYEKACGCGGADACINVGMIYRGGFGVPKDRGMEKSFFQKACEAGSQTGCTFYQKMDNEDKGIAEPGLWTKLKSLFN
ncbi:MAG: hypothetical protein RL113_1486 [Pseudomonadota bacterium]